MSCFASTGSAACNLETELAKILDGDKLYDIFVRWKPLRDEPIGKVSLLVENEDLSGQAAVLVVVESDHPERVFAQQHTIFGGQ